MKRFLPLIVGVFLLAEIGLSMVLIGSRRDTEIKNRMDELKSRYEQVNHEFRAKVKKYLSELSLVMTQNGLTKKWQADYFFLRAQRARKEGYEIMAQLYFEQYQILIQESFELSKSE